METFTISKELLVEMAGWGNSKDNKRIRELFPEAFEPELKTGIWYKSTKEGNNFLLFVESYTERNGYLYITWYGFDHSGRWINKETEEILNFKQRSEPATEEEVFERLKEEAFKRGFKKGVTVDRNKLKEVAFFNNLIVEILEDDFNYDNGCLYLENRLIFTKGIWAEICITKEEAEKELGKKII